MTGRTVDGFTVPESPIELSDGSVVISDRPHRELWKVDFESGIRVPHGRVGDGPGEYRNVHGVLRLRADTVVVFQMGGHVRLSVLGEDGSPVQTHTLYDIAVRGEQRWQLEHIPIFAATDSDGRMYGTRMSLVPLPGGDTRYLDSMPLVRLDLAAEAYDTVATFTPGDEGSPRRLQPPQRGWQIGTGPFAAKNAWVVSPTGTIYVVNASTYSIGRLSREGVETIGTRAHINKIPLEAGAWDRHVKSMSKTLNEGFNRMVGAALAPGGGSAPGHQVMVSGEAPTHYPPVSIGAHSRVHIALGELWVPVSHTRMHLHERWEVVDTAARLLATYELPPHSKLLGVTDRNLYVSEIDEDELHSIVRYPNPRGFPKQTAREDW